MISGNLCCASEENGCACEPVLCGSALFCAFGGIGKPALRRADGTFELLTYPHNMFVGATKKARYQNREFELHPGDCIFVYTDGVPEATNEARARLGEARMLEALNRRADAAPEALVLHMHDAVNGFAASAEQFDDITMLCMKYNGPQKPDGHPERN